MNGPTRSGDGPRLFVITGICGSGKSTVARLLAGQFPRSVMIEGDALRRMVVSGRAEMEPEPAHEAVLQFSLRIRHLAFLADSYLHAGFTVVAEDNLIGEYLERFLAMVSSRPVHVIALTPSPEEATRRDAARTQPAYGQGGWTAHDLDAAFHQDTKKLGLWLDTTGQQPAETVEEILRRVDESALR